MRRPLLVLGLLGSALALGLGAEAADRQTAQVAGGTTWEGTWDTNWGTMVLDARGNGTYTYDQGHITATSMTETTLLGRWDEAPTRKGPRDAGLFHFTMGGEGDSMTGKWSYAESPDSWHGDWSGTCRGGRCTKNNRTFRVTFSFTQAGLPPKHTNDLLEVRTVGKGSADWDSGCIVWGQHCYARGRLVQDVEYVLSDDERIVIVPDRVRWYQVSGRFRTLVFDGWILSSNDKDCPPTKDKSEIWNNHNPDQIRIVLFDGGGAEPDRIATNFGTSCRGHTFAFTGRQRVQVTIDD